MTTSIKLKFLSPHSTTHTMFFLIKSWVFVWGVGGWMLHYHQKTEVDWGTMI